MRLQELDQYLQRMDFKDVLNLNDLIFPKILEAKEEILSLAQFSPDTYCRNVISQENLKYSLVIIGWKPLQFSPIHNHPSQGCMVIPFQGVLEEIRYNESTLNPIGKSQIEFGQFSYITDKLGVHALGNASDKEQAVSLHIYSPGIFKATTFT